MSAVGRTMAAQMLFTGELISAEQALASGLVSELHAPDALMGRAMALARVRMRRLGRGADVSKSDERSVRRMLGI